MNSKRRLRIPHTVGTDPVKGDAATHGSISNLLHTSDLLHFKLAPVLVVFWEGQANVSCFPEGNLLKLMDGASAPQWPYVRERMPFLLDTKVSFISRIVFAVDPDCGSASLNSGTPWKTQ